MQRFLLPLFLMSVAGLISLFIIVPQYEEIRMLQAEEIALQQDIADAETIGQKVAKLKSEYASFPPGEEAKLDVMLPSSIDEVRLIADINAIAKKHDLPMETPGVSVGGKDKPGSGAEQPSSGPQVLATTIDLEVVCTQSEFISFFQDVERSLALRDVVKLSFHASDVVGGYTARSKKTGEPLRTYQVTLKTYSYE